MRILLATDAWSPQVNGVVRTWQQTVRELEAMGHDLDDPLWTARVLIERPEVVTAAHRAFHTAGAQVAITASYQVSREGFRAVGLTDADADAALRASVSAARQAGCEIVAASVGPYGAITHDGAEYRGRYGRSIDELASFHAERIAVLVDAGPDLLAVETIPDAEEMAAIAQVLQSHPDVPVWCAFTAADGATLCAGHAIEDAVRIATACPSVMAVGINCTGPEHVPELIVRIAATTRLPVIAYPNAGGTWAGSPPTGIPSGAATPTGGAAAVSTKPPEAPPGPVDSKSLLPMRMMARIEPRRSASTTGSTPGSSRVLTSVSTPATASS